MLHIFTYTVSQKKYTKLAVTTLSILSDFQNSFTAGTREVNFQQNPYNSSLQYVATLLCKI